VGTTGNASKTAPHLHFAMMKLDADGKWYKGTPVNPYPYLVDADS
jgi:murein DD-endopeptidase MepM/ murein hydrolase activator NlpD